MWTLTSTSTAWNASKCTGQYECNPSRALGGIRNSCTAAGEASKEACNSGLYGAHQSLQVSEFLL